MDSHFDIIILGTGLSESIAAAALSKAGLKVGHIDSNQYYGADEASLSTAELRQCVSAACKDTASGGRLSSASLSGELPSSSRDYSISLSPSIIASKGPLISALIGSGVARYGGFRLLESLSVYSTEGFKNVPGSKEEIFKSKELTLVDKRRLMRFLVFASGEFETSIELKGEEPGEESNKESMPFIAFLGQVFSLNEQLASALTYALALCQSSSDSTLPALTRIRQYLRSSGRYGPSPFLIGQYGGLGELAQGFCRVCAVSGGTYILGRDIQSIETKQNEASSNSETKNFRLSLSDVPEELTADVVISSLRFLPRFKTQGEILDRRTAQQAYCIALIDGALSQSSLTQSTPSLGESSEGQEEGDSNVAAESKPRPIDAALLVFPPGALSSGQASGPVNVLVNGEGTLSCPRGKSILYLSTPIETSSTDGETSSLPDPESLLRPYLEVTLSQVRTLSDVPPKELSSAFYIKSTSTLPISAIDTLRERGIILSSPLPDHFAEAGDAAAVTAENLFRDVLKSLGREDWSDVEFWPPLPARVDDDDEM